MFMGALFSLLFFVTFLRLFETGDTLKSCVRMQHPVRCVFTEAALAQNSSIVVMQQYILSNLHFKQLLILPDN